MATHTVTQTIGIQLLATTHALSANKYPHFISTRLFEKQRKCDQRIREVELGSQFYSSCLFDIKGTQKTCLSGPTL